MPSPRPWVTQLKGMLLTLTALGGLSGCTVSGTRRDSSDTQAGADRNASTSKTVILTTFTVLADMGQNVAGNEAIVQSLVKPGAEIHGYEPTPSDLVRAQDASLILDNGLNLERWAQRFYNSVPKVPHKTLSRGVQPIGITQGNYQGKPNPHAWMSPKNALIYVDNIRQALAEVNPDQAAVFKRNAATYQAQIKAIDQKLQKAIAAVPPAKRYLVSCEGAFSYLARDYGIQEAYLWAVNAEQQAVPQQIERVIETVRAKKIPAVFCESTVSDKAMRQVAKESGAKFGGVFFVDSLSPRDGPASTYLKLLEHNVTTLIQGLQGSLSP